MDMNVAVQPIQRRRSPVAFVRAGCAIALTVLTAATLAYAGRERVSGVTNFGRVTDNFFRGGKVTARGLESLHAMGVRTVIDLAGNNSGEERTCRRLGIKYYSFPMDVDQRPDDASVEEILSILQDAREPVYAHCSAGKHRAGTITALYRMRVQGWPAKRAWAEQESYGFGPANKHRTLYEYVYGRGGRRSGEGATY